MWFRRETEREGERKKKKTYSKIINAMRCDAIRCLSVFVKFISRKCVHFNQNQQNIPHSLSSLTKNLRFSVQNFIPNHLCHFQISFHSLSPSFLFFCFFFGKLWISNTNTKKSGKIQIWWILKKMATTTLEPFYTHPIFRAYFAHRTSHTVHSSHYPM